MHIVEKGVAGTPGTHTHCHRAMTFDSDSTKHGILIGEQIVKSRSIHEKYTELITYETTRTGHPGTNNLPQGLD